jgi:hypothetical protein
MDEPIKTNEPAPSPDENITPEVSFLRGFLSRVTELLHSDADLKARLTGPARLVCELLDASSRIYIFESEFKKLKAWLSKDAALQKVHLAHTNTEADAAFFNQQNSLHQKASEPGFDHSSILSRDQWREKFQAIRQSALAEQQRLWRENIELAREIAHRVEPVILEQAASLEISEKEKFTRYGLSYAPGSSPVVIACRAAAKFVISRVTLDTATGGPSACLPWLLL